MSEIKDLSDLLQLEIQGLLDAADQLTEAIPGLADKVAEPELKALFRKHLEETKMQKQRLEQVAKLLDFKPAGKDNPGMRGLIKEADKTMHLKHSPEALDAAIIAGAQKIAHYKIAGYGTAAHLALGLALDEVHDLLKKSLAEEQAIDTKLNNLAKSTINKRAARL